MMDSADLFLTKPGGISTTEAMVKGLPMVLVNVVGGCETPNLEFLRLPRRRGYGRHAGGRSPRSARSCWKTTKNASSCASRCWP